MWLKGAGSNAPISQVLRDHLKGCDECRYLTEAYETAVDTVRESVDEPIPLEPDMEGIRALMDNVSDTRRTVAGRYWRVVVAAAAAAAVVVGFGTIFLLSDRGGFDSDVTGPVASGTPEHGASPRSNEGYSVAAGQLIETGESDASISDTRIGRVTMDPNTRMKVEAWHADRTDLFLHEGVIEAVVLPRETGATFEVRTEFAVVRVLGTRFRVRHEPGIETTVTSLDGEINVETSLDRGVVAMQPGRVLKVNRFDVAGPVVVAEVANSKGVIPIHQSPRVKTKKANRKAPSLEDVVVEARRLLSRRKADEAIDLLDRFIGEGGEALPRVMALMGDAYQVGGMFEEARDAYTQALTAGPSTAPEGVFVDLARLCRDRMDDPVEARRAWERYLAAYPKGLYAARAMYEVAGLIRSEHGLDEALDTYGRLLDRRPRSSEAAIALGEVGMGLLSLHGAKEAEGWLAPFRESDVRGLAETALVGLMGVRRHQGDREGLRALAKEHAGRFPKGRMKGDVESLLSGIKAGEQR